MWVFTMGRPRRSLATGTPLTIVRMNWFPRRVVSRGRSNAKSCLSRPKRRGVSRIMREAVIVSTARTPIGRAYRGAFNATPSPTLAAHAIRAAVERAAIDPREVDDVIVGAALQQGVQHTIGRTGALRAGLPASVAGLSIDRQCASGLMAIATAAKQVIVDRMSIVVAGGVESISLVQTPGLRVDPDQELLGIAPDIYMSM